MFPSSFKQFYAILVLSFVLALGFMTYLIPETTEVTGYAVAPTENSLSTNWPIFLFGITIGAVIVAGVVLVAQHEMRKL